MTFCHADVTKMSRTCHTCVTPIFPNFEKSSQNEKLKHGIINSRTADGTRHTEVVRQFEKWLFFVTKCHTEIRD